MSTAVAGLTLDNVLYEKKASIAYVTLNRPKVLNALNKALIADLKAAFEDARFSPATLEEALALEVSLSILSPLKAIKPEEVEIGVHGLVVSQGGRRGLLLPQVPTEHQWDRVTFIEQTCRKAGLPLDALQKGAKLEAFTSEVFGDRD